MFDLIGEHPGVLVLFVMLTVLPLAAGAVAAVQRLWWTFGVAVVDFVITAVSAGMLVWLNYNIGTGPDHMDNVVEGFLIIVPVGFSGMIASMVLALVLIALLVDGLVFRPRRKAKAAAMAWGR